MARTVVKTVEVFKVTELNGVNYRNALESASRQRMEDWGEFSSSELLTSMQKAAEYFGLEVVDWSIGIFDRSWIKIDSDRFDDEQAPFAVEWLRENLKAGQDGSCPFTGVYYDGYFFDYFKDHEMPTGDDPEKVKRVLTKAIIRMMTLAIGDAENSLLSDEDTLEYIDGQELEFTGDGEVFYG